MPEDRKELISWPSIFLFGDSLTQRSFDVDTGCWGAALASHFQRKCDVTSRGFSGYNTRMCKYVLPRIFDASCAPSIAGFVFCLGANDACDPSDLGKQHIPLEEYTKNLQEMFDYLKSTGLSTSKIIAMTPPPYFHEKWAEHQKNSGNAEPKRDVKLVEQYAEAVRDVAERNKIVLVDLFAELSKEKDCEKFFCDGLHFSKEGALKVFSLLQPHLDKLVAELPDILPLWDSINREDPEFSFKQWINENK